MNSTLASSAVLAAENTSSSLALRPRDAANALGISERLLWDWTHHGDIPHVRVGRIILYPIDSLRNWLSRQAEAVNGGAK